MRQSIIDSGWNCVMPAGWKISDRAGDMDAQAYIDTIEGENSTVALVTNAIKSLFTFTSEIGYTLNIGKMLRAPKTRSKLAQRILSEGDMLLMLKMETNARNHALLRLMYHAGLRVSEVVALKWEDVRETANGAVLDVWGKGDKQRSVSISKSMHEELTGLPGQRSLRAPVQGEQRGNPPDG
jgi:integrase/recombinase XerD